MMKRRGSHPEKALSAIKVRSLSQPGRYADGNGLYLARKCAAALGGTLHLRFLPDAVRDKLLAVVHRPHLVISANLFDRCSPSSCCR